MDKVDKFDNLRKRYITPGDILAFSGRTKVARELSISAEEAHKKIHSRTFAYGLHRFYKKPKYVNPYFSYFPRDQIQIDLIDFRKLSKYNDGVHYVLAAIDIFTRKAWVYTLKNKTAESCEIRMRELLRDVGPFLPKAIMFDRGTEFINKRVSALLAGYNIKVILPNTESKAAYVERFNLTLQSKLYMHMTQNNTHRYIDVLPSLLHSYNTQKHVSLGGIYSPNQAEMDENIARVRFMQMERRGKHIQIGAKMKPKFTIGDVVRIKTQSGKFARGYDEKFSNEYFRVIKIEKKFPILSYRLVSLNVGDNIQGIFYANELQLVQGNIYPIENILKTRKRNGKKEYLIKWTGFGPQHNSWVKQEDMADQGS